MPVVRASTAMLPGLEHRTWILFEAFGNRHAAAASSCAGDTPRKRFCSICRRIPAPTLSRIHRGHDVATFGEAYCRLRLAGMGVAIQMILGLPGETATEVIQTAHYVADLHPVGVELHNLVALEGTELYQQARRSVSPGRNGVSRPRHRVSRADPSGYPGRAADVRSSPERCPSPPCPPRQGRVLSVARTHHARTQDVSGALRRRTELNGS